MSCHCHDVVAMAPVEAPARWRREVDRAYMGRVAESVGYFIRSGLPPTWLRAPVLRDYSLGNTSELEDAA